ncbi:hypothetical protein [Albimonas pacifica]|uniref:Class II flagellar assembly regulator n=1 Tax=Albimonas pacifica TaxID=1114924 RepID=A0A1I3FS60_9RHOB|nr:hypothetical protein [Albimonas pacifica]SFI14039.1 hypothetical protein SAMN05216258_104483 [Albimonas pacifica]
MTDSHRPTGDAPAPEATLRDGTPAAAGPCSRPSLRLIQGGRAAAAPPARAAGRAACDLSPSPSAPRRRRRRRPAPPPEVEPEDLADAALLLLTSVREAQDARRVIERLSAEVDADALEAMLEAVAARLALLARAAHARPRPV